MAWSSSSKCPAPALSSSLVHPRRPRRRVRPRCCEDTLGVPLRRHRAQQHQLLFPEHAAAAGQYQRLQSGSNGALIPPPPPRPRRIVLVRHGESEGNVDETAYTRVPDPRIGLTAKGWQDAEDCGRRLRDLFSSDSDQAADDWKVYFYVSPYRRTLETLRGIGRAFEDPRRIAGVREDARLREQDFGNFQDRDKMRVEKETRLRYGRFFYRFPDGESAADVYDRITGFRETLRADIDIGRFQPPAGQRSQHMNVVIVSHGLTLRVFLMRWYKWTVRQFEGLNNFGNGGTLVMQTGQGGRYSLLVHHTSDELREFGLTDQMLHDQMWQKTANIGELNYDFMTHHQSFFDE
jgi:broad specificity phosphatase PhoE